MTITTTLKEIRKYRPCEDGWRKLLNHLGKTAADDKPLPLRTILESNGVDDFLWCLRVLPEDYHGPARLLACDFAERVLHLVPEGEDRPRQAIEVARRFAMGEATEEELASACAAAWAARAAARDAAWAAARDAARAAAGDAAGDAAWAAAGDAAWAAAGDAAWDAWAAARVAESVAQHAIIRKWLDELEAAA